MVVGCFVFFFFSSNPVFQHVRMDIYHIGTGLETSENAKYGNERKATGFPRVIQRLFEKRKRKH